MIFAVGEVEWFSQNIKRIKLNLCMQIFQNCPNNNSGSISLLNFDKTDKKRQEINVKVIKITSFASKR